MNNVVICHISHDDEIAVLRRENEMSINELRMMMLLSRLPTIHLEHRVFFFTIHAYTNKAIAKWNSTTKQPLTWKKSIEHRWDRRRRRRDTERFAVRIQTKSYTRVGKDKRTSCVN
eukprot:scaffold73947_cov32-Cyclotella_meneghiniana.AAC.1